MAIGQGYADSIGQRASAADPKVQEFYNTKTNQGFSDPGQLSSFVNQNFQGSNTNAGNVFGTISGNYTAPARPPSTPAAPAQPAQMSAPTDYGPRPPATTAPAAAPASSVAPGDALSQVYANRPDLQQLYNPDGSAKNPNDPRTGANIATLSDWANVYGKQEEPSLANYTGAAPATPAAPATDPNRPPSDPSGLLTSITGASQPTADETALQQKIDALDASYKSGDQNIQDEQVPMHFITGEEASLNNTYQNQKQTLTQQLATLQAKRQANLTALNAQLTAQKPTEVPVGGTLINPITGATVASGQSYTSKLDYTTVQGLIKAYPDASISTSDTPEQAAAKVNNSTSFQLKAGGTYRMIVDPLTGNMVMYNNKTGTTGAPDNPISDVAVPSGNAPTSSGSASSNISFTMASDGRTVLANGTPVDLPTFQQLTGQTGKPEAQTDFSMVKKSGVAQNQTAARTGGASSSSPSSSATSPLAQIGFNPNSPTDNQALTMLQSGVTTPTGRSTLDGQIQSRARQIAQALGLGANYNLTSGKAVQNALTKQTDNYAAMKSAISAVDLNITNVLSGLMSKVNPSNSPFINDITKAVSGNILTNNDRVQFNSALQTVRSEYARILARGAIPDDSNNAAANKLLPDNISGTALQAALDIVKKEGQNNLAGTQGTLDFLKGMGAPAPANTGLTNDSSGQSIDLKF